MEDEKELPRKQLCCLETPVNHVRDSRDTDFIQGGCRSCFTSRLRMAAMHWEARRRQSLLDRRMARDKQQLLEAPRPEVSAAASDTTSAGGQCPNCQAELKTRVQRSAKIPNRYSSLQYTQQW